MLDRLKKEMAGLFTDGGRRRSSADSPIQQLRAQISDIEKQLEKAKTQYDEAERLARDLEDVESELRRLTEEEECLKEK
ncbi:MAG: hypothetical protein H5T86_10880, partial [Armatimonadetes bacterium]|nr:hypothetical protein [Armatimonadota bacterium]